jgi:glycosyltransferase involved in cell wall biosynthesis
MRAYIYNNVFLVRVGSPVVNIGGIETLISYLIPVLLELGHQPIIYQCADVSFTTEFSGAVVHGIPFPPGTPIETIVAHFRSEAAVQAPDMEFLEIFGADHFSVPNRNPLAIAIQNGVWWDQPIEALTDKIIFHNIVGELIFRLRKQFQMLHLFENCYNRVCADLNFVNWYRTCRGSIKGRVWFNPNPAPDTTWNPRRDLPDDGRPLRIIFARRLVPQKGTRLISEVFQELLRVRPGLQITIAGEGPDEGYLREVFSEEDRVEFTSYRIDQVIAVHNDHDVAVIPSMLSEATCLAVAEAMAAGCAVVATNFGGITNQIIDGFNGLLAWPTRESLLKQLLRLLDNHAERLAMQKRGWETSQLSFSLIRWQDRWKTILETVVAGKGDALMEMSQGRRRHL